MAKPCKYKHDDSAVHIHQIHYPTYFHYEWIYTVRCAPQVPFLVEVFISLISAEATCVKRGVC